MSEHKFTNKLIDETSPYLLQHAHNPVDWYPWGPDALGRAQEENKPILLSVGYSACHWCHVMERESFENEEIARLMNELFVPIKVDREERPDLDDIYMNAVQMMTGSGGWPLTVFLTPDLKPFFGGTYFPPKDHLGRPGFKTVLERISETYREQPDKVAQNAHAVTENLRSMTHIPSSREILSADLIRKAVRDWTQRFDPSEGGFTPAPKFPPSGAIFVLLRYYRTHKDDDALQMALLTLDKMAGGACTTISAVDFTDIRPTSVGSRLISRKCSMTMRSSRWPTSKPSRSPATPATREWRGKLSSTCFARCRAPRAGTSHQKMLIAKA